MATQTLHTEAIERLCYVCGNIVMKKHHQITSPLSNEMEVVFSTSINLICQVNVAPSSICHTCWRTVKRCIKAKVEGLSFKSSKAPLEWYPHSVSCATCQLYISNKKGKRKKKPSNQYVGRPKSVGMWNANAIPLSTVSYDFARYVIRYFLSYIPYSYEL